MKTFQLVREQRLQRPLDEVFAFFSDPHNLAAMTPPWLRFRVVSSTTPKIGEGTEIEYRLRVRGVGLRWVSRITRWDPPHSFVDEQLVGPYRQWRHTHEFRVDGNETVVTDDVRYAVPGPGPLAGLIDLVFVRRDLRRIFEYRRERLQDLLDPRAPSGG